VNHRAAERFVDVQVGDHGGQVLEAEHAQVVHHLAGQDRYRYGNVLQALLPLLRGHHDFFDAGRRRDGAAGRPQANPSKPGYQADHSIHDNLPCDVSVK
jgi:hypothetical protein